MHHIGSGSPLLVCRGVGRVGKSLSQPPTRAFQSTSSCLQGCGARGRMARRFGTENASNRSSAPLATSRHSPNWLSSLNDAMPWDHPWAEPNLVLACDDTARGIPGCQGHYFLSRLSHWLLMSEVPL